MSKKFNIVKGIVHNLLNSLSSYTGIPLFFELQKHGYGTYEIDIVERRVKNIILNTVDAIKQFEYFSNWFEEELAKHNLNKSDFKSVKILFTFERSKMLFFIPCYSYKYTAVVNYKNEEIVDTIEGKGWK